ncbi:hypothetical protein BLNAU_21944 [Blattamonas nauphoetae]|uniref:Uncharacterized protein n=1 Tax=Blattamonas nauphoetae TaxID=2049346 RepID=A0ABQ9WUF1_9EUKA|nr:hypothetical protein BLNAU_21944 [Blattamonas nauphoetae]
MRYEACRVERSLANPQPASVRTQLLPPPPPPVHLNQSLSQSHSSNNFSPRGGFIKDAEKVIQEERADPVQLCEEPGGESQVS